MPAQLRVLERTAVPGEDLVALQHAFDAADEELKRNETRDDVP